MQEIPQGFFILFALFGGGYMLHFLTRKLSPQQIRNTILHGDKDYD